MSQKYTKIIELFTLASKELQYPRIRLMNDVVLSKAGVNAQFPSSINITDGKPYGQNVFYGRIFKDGILRLNARCTDAQLDIAEHELDSFHNNPYEYAKMYGKANANCMYCGKALTDPQSVAVGYGPICAAHYGLPHGELEQEVANELSQVVMELPASEINQCDCGKYKNSECDCKASSSSQFEMEMPVASQDKPVIESHYDAVMSLDDFKELGLSLEDVVFPIVCKRELLS